MKAVLLVGGEGMRLRPLTARVPKPLVPIMNFPYLEQLLFFLEKFGVDEVILTACYLSSRIEAFCGSRQSGMKLTYVVEETPLGTGGAVGNVSSHLNDTFLVFNGDVITDFNRENLMKFHRERKGMMTLALVPVEDTSRYGVADLQKDGRISTFVEKPPREEAPSPYINAGMYVMEPEILSRIPGGVKFSIERGLFPELARQDSLYGLVEEAYWLDIGTPEGYFQVHQDALDGKIGLRMNSHQARSRRRGSKVFAGEGSEIEPGAEVGPYVVLGRNCRVEKGAKVAEAVLWDNVVIEKGAGVFHAIIGSDYRVESGKNLNHVIASADGEKVF